MYVLFVDGINAATVNEVSSDSAGGIGHGLRGGCCNDHGWFDMLKASVIKNTSR